MPHAQRTYGPYKLMKIIEWIFNNFEYFVLIIGFLLLLILVIAYIHTSIAIAKLGKEQELTDNEQKTE